jgi:hypothetical protein
VTVSSNGVWGTMYGDATGAPSYGCVRFPLVLARAFRDGRVFENLSVQPRFYPTWESRRLSTGEFLEAEAIEPAAVTTFHSPIPLDVVALAEVPSERRRAAIDAGSIENGTTTLAVESAAPFLLVSSEKVTPELEVRLDGAPARVLTVNTMFAALLVPEGRHEVVFERRLGRGWLPWSLAGLILIVAGGVSDVRRRVARS